MRGLEDLPGAPGSLRGAQGPGRLRGVAGRWARGPGLGSFVDAEV